MMIGVGFLSSVARRFVRCNRRRLVFLLLLSGVCQSAWAGKPMVEFVALEAVNGVWTAHVTIRHADSGWQHYADAWRIVGPDHQVLGTRTLYHPHETEQPFTRTLSGISIPPSLKWVAVQAHDKVHGWGDAVRVDLDRSEGDRFRIRRR